MKCFDTDVLSAHIVVQLQKVIKFCLSFLVFLPPNISIPVFLGDEYGNEVAFSDGRCGASAPRLHGIQG